MIDVRRGQSGQAIKSSLELMVAQHQKRRVHVCTRACTNIRKYMRAYASIAGQASCSLLADATREHLPRRRTGRAWHMAQSSRKGQGTGQKRAQLLKKHTTRKLDAKCMARQTGTKLHVLAPPLAPRTKVRSPLIPLTAAVAEPNLMGRGCLSRGGQTIMWWARLMAWTCRGHRRVREGRVDSCCNSNSRERQGVSD